MKWSIVILIALGLLAALCAAALVFVLRADTSGKSTPTEVIIAAKSLPAMSVVTSSSIIKDKIAKEKLPEGYLSVPIQAIGRVLSMPVVEGQVLTQSCLIMEGTGQHLATAIPHGMRAVGVTLANYSITGGLLYPGCMVDVLVAFRLPSGERVKGQAISTTLLHNVEVLAVESTTVASKPKKDSDTAKQHTEGRRLAITLMVDPEQAEALQLAMENGSISLAVRNPLDKRPVDTDVTVLNENNLASLGSVMGPTVLCHGDNSIDSAKETDDLFGRSPQWNVTVIRGREITDQGVKAPTDEIVPTDSQK